MSVRQIESPAACPRCGGAPEVQRQGAYWRLFCNAGHSINWVAGHTMKTKWEAVREWNREHGQPVEDKQEGVPMSTQHKLKDDQFDVAARLAVLLTSWGGMSQDARQAMAGRVIEAEIRGIGEAAAISVDGLRWRIWIVQ